MRSTPDEPARPDEVDPRLLDESAEDLYEHAPCGYLSTLPDGLIVKANQTFLDWTGYAREELVGARRLQTLLGVGGRIFYETHLAPLMDLHGQLRGVSLDVIRPGRPPLPVLINAVRRQAAPGAAALHRITVFDMTERRAYERELLVARRRAEEAARSKADFLSMMSHEIRTPLGIIRNVAHLLDRSDPTERQRRYIDILGKSSRGLLELVNDILDFNKLEAGKATLVERPVDLRELVADALQGLRVRAEAKRLALDVRIADDVPRLVLGDAIKLRQVLTNLIGNAVKFTERGAVSTTLQVAERTGEAVVVAFEVADTGIGIPPDRLPHLFQDYTQASADVGARYGGTGLGLAISQRLVQLHGGRIEVQSAPGRGSTFSFRLRLRVAPQAAPPDAGPAEDARLRALRGLRVLLVEDDPVTAAVLGEVLGEHGVRLRVARSGQEALDEVAREDHAVILMDLHVGDESGYEIAAALRAHPSGRCRDVPMIAVSGSTRVGHEERLAAAGFSAFLGKPLDPELLLARLVELASPAAAAPAPARPAAARVAEPPTSRSDPDLLLPPFTLDRLRERSGAGGPGFARLCATTGDACRALGRRLDDALARRTPEAFAEIAAEARPLVSLLEAHALWSALHQVGALLNGPDAPARVEPAAAAARGALDALIAALSKHAGAEEA